jgi:glucokinase
MGELKYYIAIDLGGTNIKAGIIDENGLTIRKESVKTGKDRTSSEIINDMANLCKYISKEEKIPFDKIEAIGIGAPGSIDSKNGVIVYSNNLNWDKVNLTEQLQKLTGKRAFVTNDANAAALGEAKYGSGKNYSDSVLITLGTGVGGGIVIDGKLFEGYKSAGAEVGHMVIIENGEQCTCGRKGCFEAYSSATALIRDTKNSMKYHKNSKMWEIAEYDIEKADGRTAFLAARQGDPFGKEVVEMYIQHLSEGIVNLVNILRPQVVILGGGVCNEGEYLLNPLKELVSLKMYGGCEYAPVELKIASLGNDAGLLGAFAFALQNI